MPHARYARYAAIAAIVVATPVAAQMTGIPVLQNAFSNPGLSAGINVGTSDLGAAYGGAAAWAPGNGRFQASAGLGVLTFQDEDIKSTPIFGIRGAYVLPFLGGGTGSIGTAVFLGVGGGTSDDIKIISYPLGLAASYRRAIGTTRAISAYLTPFYNWTRITVGEGAEVSDSGFRASLGVDVTVVPRLGATAGYDFGGSASDDGTGVGSNVFGFGVSWAFR